MHLTDNVTVHVPAVRLDADVDHTREFPTGYHYLLYEIFGTLEHWIEDSTRVDQSLPSVEIDKVGMAIQLEPYYIFLGRSNQDVPALAFEFTPRAVHAAGRLDVHTKDQIVDAARTLMRPHVRML